MEDRGQAQMSFLRHVVVVVVVVSEWSLPLSGPSASPAPGLLRMYHHTWLFYVGPRA